MSSLKQKYSVLGVMSGTSLDGIDIAEISFEVDQNNNWSFFFGKVSTIPYALEWKERLKEAVHFSQGRLQTLNRTYTHYLGTVISEFIQKHDIDNLDAVCSHGHTILHQPDQGITLQIGNLPEIAPLVGQKVICDFRVQDVVMGGQGAPLVPIGDRLLFPTYDYCLNLGGFANCSFENQGSRIAFDICPVNIVLNLFAENLGMPYDDKGKIAANGTIDEAILQQLNELSFYQQLPPKSLGLEWVNQEVMPLFASETISEEDKIATFTEHVAIQLASQFDEGSSVLVTGGGAYNCYLLERLKMHCDLNLIVPDKTLLEFKEALIFGLLGVLKLRGEVNCLASVTGASKDHSSGVIFS